MKQKCIQAKYTYHYLKKVSRHKGRKMDNLFSQRKKGRDGIDTEKKYVLKIEI